MRVIQGTSRDDRLFGDNDADTISGLGGNDSLYGRYGDDDLDGGAGNDFLSGGPGSDTYHFDVGYDRDEISNYPYISPERGSWQGRRDRAGGGYRC